MKASETAEISEDEIKRILKSDSGFSAELKTLDVFLQKKIDVQANVYFIDPEQNKPREIDIVSTVRYRNIETTYGSVLFEFGCVCDVKSSSAATVILSSPPTGPERWSVLSGFVAHVHEVTRDGEKKEETHFGGVSNILGATHFAKRIGRIALRVNSKSEAKDRNRVSDQATHEAMFAAGKAAQYFLSRRKDHVRFDLDLLYGEKYLVYLSIPMVVVDGPMFEYFYIEGKEHIVKADFVPVRFSRARTSAPSNESGQHSRLVVDNDLILFCQIDYIAKFLDRLTTWVNSHGLKSLESTLKAVETSKQLDDIPF